MHLATSNRTILNSIIDAMPDFVFWKDRHGIFCGCNQAFAGLCFGLSREQVVGKSDLELVSDPDLAASLRQEDLDVMAAGTTLRRDVCFVLADGFLRCFDTQKIPLTHPDGEVYGLLIIARDVTETRTLHKALLENQALLNKAQRIALLGCWEFNIVTGQLDWSDEIYRIFELDPATFKPSYSTFFDVIHPDDCKMVHETYQHSLQTREPCTISHRILLPDGRIKYVKERCETSFDDTGAPVCSVGTVQDITEQTVLQETLEQIVQAEQEQYSFHAIVTNNPAMKQTLELAARVSRFRMTTVAIYGESGSGKEVLARAIHASGSSLPGKFIAVNCAAIPENLLESELFGHVRGAFTGADTDRDGKFCLAKGGTILLDEIGDMPLPLQAKLLRVLEERTFEKVGGNLLLRADCRIIVATNRDLSRMVLEGRFREDLFHRINVFPLVIPPLRERKEDIPLLCDYLLTMLRQQIGRPLLGISNYATQQLKDYDWPGNVRELRNRLERAAILCKDGLIRSEQLGLGYAAPVSNPSAASEDSVSYTLSLPADGLSLDALHAQILAITLERCNGNKAQASKLLKIGRSSYYR